MKLLFLLFIFTNMLFASVGNIVTLSGDVDVQRDNKMIKALVGFALEKKDTLFTKENASAKIKLIDGTTVNIGKNSTFNIEEFILDEITPSNSETKLNILKGAFKAVTGKIGKLNPSKFKLKTSNATIGIRGTIVIADQESVGCLKGSISVMASGRSIIVNAGSISHTIQGQTPTKPEKIKQSVLQKFNEKLDIIEDLSPVKSDKTDTSLSNEKREILPKKPDTNIASTYAQDSQELSTTDTIQEAINTNNETPPSTTPPSVTPTTVAYSGLSAGIIGLEARTYNANISINDTEVTGSFSGLAGLNDFTIIPNLTETDGVSEEYSYINEDNFHAHIKYHEASKGEASITGDIYTYTDDLDNESSWGHWDGVSEDSSGNSLLATSSEQYFVVGNITPTSVIDSYITQEKILDFKGKIMGSILQTSDNSLDNIVDDATNVFNLSLDFGSGTGASGDFAFKTIEGKSASANFSGGSITNNGFSTTEISGTFDGKNIDSSDLQGKYFGTDEVKSVGGTIQFVTDDEYKMSGVFKADKQ